MSFALPRAFQPLLDPIGSYRWRVYYGGRGSAKSHSFARALLYHGMRRRLRIFCLREYQTSMRQSVHLILSDLIRKIGLGGVYRVTRNEILGASGTEFFFGGLRHDIDQIKSTEGIDIAWVEEAQSVHRDSWQTLIPTIRQEGSELWVSYNPAEFTDETHQRFGIEAKRPARSLIRKVTWRDNPYLSQVLRDEREELLRNDPEAENHVWEGEPWSRSEAQVLKGKFRVEDFTPNPETWGEPLFGLDFGFSRDPLVCVKLWRRDRTLFVEYADGGIEKDHRDTVELLDTIPGTREHLIFADSSRPETINELRNSGFNIVGAEKWAGSVKDGISHLRSYKEIVIHGRAKMAIDEARLWRYKTDPRTQAVISKLRDGNDNSWDASRYALSRVIQRRGGGMVWYPGMDGEPEAGSQVGRDNADADPDGQE